jgi:cell division protein FtsN
MPKGAFGHSGGMLLGLVLGLVIGLAIAVAVALYISNAPLPFVTKVRPPSAAPTLPADGKLPDPNKSFSAGTPPPAPAAAAAPPAPPAAKAGTVDATTPATPEAAAAKEETLPEGSRFLLQAGAFRSPDDADGMRAQLAMIGLDARIFPIEQGGHTLYRVRLGPYGHLDDVNRVRKLLADNNIEAQVVRLR